MSPQRLFVEKVIAPVAHLGANWISRIGVVLVTTSVVFWVLLLPMSLRSNAHPYLGMAEFLLIPGVFVIGLLIIPFGMWVHVRWLRAKGRDTSTAGPLSLRGVELRNLGIFIGGITVFNLFLAGLFAYQGVGYMDSVKFCGQTCHTVMQPEYTAYQGSPHSRVECVACHIGPGASWFVQSKLSGSWQLIAVTFNLYPRPIPTPVRNLRPARETCEACHWPQKYGEDRLRVVDSYADDENNTRTRSVLLMRIGGGHGSPGIHGAHLGPGVSIHYRPADESRQTIPQVEYSNTVTGKTAVYTAADAKADAVAKLPVREMDCMDCHNRPTHTFTLPERAVNRALAAGEISPTLPFVKKQGVALLKKTYASHDDAAKAIPAALAQFYRTSRADVYNSRQADIEAAGRALVAIYRRNVFPAMNVKWGTYPNNIGHMDFPGCYRCHDDAHAATGGKKITQDCNACHQLLAMDEAAPKILTDLGLQ